MDQMERCTEEKSLEDTPGTLQFTRTLARTYRLFGNLFLSEPPLKLRDKVDELRPYLLELEHREKSTEIDHKAISDELSSFQLAETQLWKDPLPTRCLEHIVRPSGSWQARIAHHLHNPSYTTLHAKNGEVADVTNGCTALIMNHHYDPELHFMFDHFHRREDFCPFAKYPDHIRAFHENHTEWIRSTVQAKIEIIYGSSVRKWAMKHLDLTSLSLWGEYEGVWLHFEWKPIVAGKKIARIIIFALHPQRFLSYQSRSQREAIEQDLRISVAHQLACLPFTADYYATRLWTSKAEFIQNAYFNEWCLAEKENSRFGIIDLPRQRNVPTPDAACPIITDTSEVMSFKSRKRLGSREFRQEYKSLNMQNDLLESLPCAVMREWFEAQQHSFFGGISIRTRDDLLFAYKKHCVGGDGPQSSNLNTMELIQGLMNFQQARIRNRIYRAYRPTARSSCYYSTLESMPCVCDNCRCPQPPDLLPRFSIQHSGIYICRDCKCNSEACYETTRYAIPADQTPYMVFDFLIDTTVAARKLIRTDDECEGYSTTVKLCPQWTKGARPKYIPRSFTCHNCSRNDQHFVPVNGDISFIPLRDLAIFAFNFSYMDDQTLIAHLEARPSSTFTTRSYTRRSQVNLGNANTPGSLDTGPPLKRRRGTRKVDASQVQLPNRIAGEPSEDNDDDPTEPNGGKSMIENYSKPAIIELKCSKCGQRCGSNYRPRWHRDTGDYIALSRPQCPQGCTNQKVWLVPVSDVEYMTANMLEARERSDERHRQTYGPVLHLANPLSERALRMTSWRVRSLGQQKLQNELHLY
ncbi:uncharacterized protein BO87DRAFT_433432 [Aspergillus neoniger CBS 115656]|uniref:Uncharacterized protein n=1 Tax=Aspergillus neoniger (strain CBS 115656) TaxID=1448310 RepID=A0A318YM34_ASPNB|nr:hypothetical protein BO87DRAFT_433432 [Aspergillus neoniger CBS 115656]PYH35665.1 hypothetical protein BO87DRAFT_433432 [Aspergillus neoniger CBS 115656]